MTIKDYVLTGITAIFGWLILSAGIMLVSNQAPAGRVLFPSAQFINSFTDATSILNHDRFSITLVMKDLPASELYRAGAWFVLPAGLTGCLPLPDKIKP